LHGNRIDALEREQKTLKAIEQELDELRQKDAQMCGDGQVANDLA